jgi:hypothetical protein
MSLKNNIFANCHKLEFKIEFYQVQANLKKAEIFFSTNKKILEDKLRNNLRKYFVHSSPQVVKNNKKLYLSNNYNYI